MRGVVPSQLNIIQSPGIPLHYSPSAGTTAFSEEEKRVKQKRTTWNLNHSPIIRMWNRSPVQGYHLSDIKPAFIRDRYYRCIRNKTLEVQLRHSLLVQHKALIFVLDYSVTDVTYEWNIDNRTCISQRWFQDA